MEILLAGRRREVEVTGVDEPVVVFPVDQVVDLAAVLVFC